MFLALTCPVCGSRGQVPCGGCLHLLKPAPPAPPPRGVDVAWSLFSYEGHTRRLITAMKYGNNRAVVPGLGRAMANLVASSTAGNFQVVTWVPTTSRRRRKRGFDQAELLAKAVAKELSLPSKGLLTHHPGPAQTGRNLASRRIGPPITALGRCPSRILLVDDVMTSGTSAAAAAGALRDGGAHFVALLSAARTPRVIQYK